MRHLGNTPPHPEIKRIKAFCEASHVTQACLGKLAGLHTDTSAKYLSGKFFCPDIRIEQFLAAIERIKEHAKERGISLALSSSELLREKDPECRMKTLEKELESVKDQLDCLTYGHKQTNAKLDSVIESRDMDSTRILELKYELNETRNKFDSKIWSTGMDVAEEVSHLEDRVSKKLDGCWQYAIFSIVIGAVFIAAGLVCHVLAL